MKHVDEAEAVEKVAKKLVEKFPEIPEATVHEVVDEEHEALEGNPIRDYVPVLVEHESKERLREISRNTAPISVVSEPTS